MTIPPASLISSASILRIAACIALSCVSGFASDAQSREHPPQYVLGAEDQIRIWILGIEEISDKPARIDPSGDLDLPLIGKVHAAGLTVDQLRVHLVDRFSKEVRTPQLSIEITDFGSQPVSVMGAVNHPGIHQLRGRKTLLEVVSMAEGFRPDAGPRVTISRRLQYGPIPLRTARFDSSRQFSVGEVAVRDLLAASDPIENILIFPHDAITVPLADAVFVMGEVRKPGGIALKDDQNISVLQALASAEGFGPTPSPRNARIVRRNPESRTREEIPVDLTRIQAGKAEDIAMKPNDILVIPPSGPKKAAARALEAAIQTASGIAIWRRP